MSTSTCAPSPTLRWTTHGEKEGKTYHHQSLPNASRNDDATTCHSIYAPSAGYDGEPSQQQQQHRVARKRQHFLIPLLPEVSETRGETTSKQIMDALVTGSKIVVVPSLSSYKLAIVMSDHEERSIKSSVGNDVASTSAATSEVKKGFETWQQAENLRAVRLKFGASSKEYMVACNQVRKAVQVSRKKSLSGVKANTLLTHVKLINSVEEGNNGPDVGATDAYPMEAENLRSVLLKFGASSKEYMVAFNQVRKAVQVSRKKSLSASDEKGVGVSVITTVALVLETMTMSKQRSSSCDDGGIDTEQQNVCVLDTLPLFTAMDDAPHGKTTMNGQMVMDVVTKIPCLVHGLSADRVVVLIVRATPNVRRLSVTSAASSTLCRTKKSGTKFGTVAVAETKSWIKSFRSIQQECDLVLKVLSVVSCFGAAVIVASLASMRCLGVVQKKKPRTYFFFLFFFWHKLFFTKFFDRHFF